MTVEDRADVPECVVDQGPNNPVGQIGTHVDHLLAELEKEHRHFARRGRIAERQRNGGEGRLAVGLDFVAPGELLEFLLDAVGDLRLHLLGGRAGPFDGDNRDLDGEVGIFGSAEPRIREGACEPDHDDEKCGQLGMSDRPAR